MATGKPDKFVPSTFGLTKRQTKLLREKADEVGISTSEQLRRILDDWAARLQIPVVRPAQTR